MGRTKSGVCDYTQNFWVGCQPVSERVSALLRACRMYRIPPRFQ